MVPRCPSFLRKLGWQPYMASIISLLRPQEGQPCLSSSKYWQANGECCHLNGNADRVTKDASLDYRIILLVLFLPLEQWP